MESNRKSEDRSTSSQHQESASPLPASGPRSGRGAGGGGTAQDAPPSNTASYKCNPYFQPLRWGVDSLYLNYPGKIRQDVDVRLAALKKLAQSSEAHEQAKAQCLLSDHIFEVKDKAPKGFAYVLEDDAFRVQVSRSSKLPCAYIKISAGCLAHVGPEKAEAEAAKIADALIERQGLPTVSRIDLYLDFASTENMEWQREDWVTRAADIDRYAENGVFTGWVVGKGGIISARLYYKLHHALKMGATYLLDLWRQVGWNGESPVWRLEFQLRRELLSQFRLGTLPQVLGNLNGLWSYGTTEWLRLCIPSPEDKTRSRWPIHPLWAYLSSIDWETSGGPLTRSYRPARVPSDEYFCTQAFNLLASYMAREGIAELSAGNDALMAAMYLHHEERARRLGLGFDSYLDEKIAIKAREYNTRLNDPELAGKIDAKHMERLVREYRKGAKGGA